MTIKVNEFSIQAKVIEEDSSEEEIKSGVKLPDSVKKEIIDECLKKMEEYLERKRVT